MSISALNQSANFANKNVSDFQVYNYELTKNSEKPVILCLGEKVMGQIKNPNFISYRFITVNHSESFLAFLKSWDKIHNNRPKAVIISDLYLAKLMSEDILSKKNHSAFNAVPFVVFSEKKDKIKRDAALSIQADEYFFEPIEFDDFIQQIEFSAQLKKLGVTRQDKLPLVDDHAQIYDLKRIFDVLVASISLVVLAPIILLIAAILKMESKGPIFYTSKRAGRDYKVFEFYKFRSMNADADKQLEKLKKESNQYKDGQFVKIKNDPRITRFGNILRKTSLDELPQLLNVLKGDLSIVGNRPLPLYEAAMLTTDDHAERFLGPAGITGLWQTLKRGKGEMSASERIILDRIYVRKNSLWFDFKIIMMTFPALLQSEKV